LDELKEIESAYWQAVPSKFFEKLGVENFKEFEYQHKLFTTNSGVEFLKMFLMKNNT
jgi:hypothetical protein